MAQKNVKETLVDEICDKIKRDIIGGTLLPGDRIKSKELADRYGTSETPVKLALNRLCMDQIIDNYPRQGMRVHEFTVNEAMDIYELREMIDLFYVEQVIATLTYNSETKKLFKDNIEEYSRLAKKKPEKLGREDLYRFFQLDYEFHELYLKCAGNQKLMDLYRNMNPYVSTNNYFDQAFERDLETVDEHTRIIEALTSGDPEMARQAISHHYEKSKTAVAARLRVSELLKKQ